MKNINERNIEYKSELEKMMKIIKIPLKQSLIINFVILFFAVSMLFLFAQLTLAVIDESFNILLLGSFAALGMIAIKQLDKMVFTATMNQLLELQPSREIIANALAIGGGAIRPQVGLAMERYISLCDSL